MRKFNPATQVDFVIIGSGAAGGAMAKELSTAGFEVVVLEQGPRMEDRDFKHDELKIRDTPALVNDHALQPNTFRKTADEKAQLAPTISYGRCGGGGTVHYTGSHWGFRGLAAHLRGAATFLRESRIRIRGFGNQRKKPLRLSAIETISPSAFAHK